MSAAALSSQVELTLGEGASTVAPRPPGRGRRSTPAGFGSRQLQPTSLGRALLLVSLLLLGLNWGLSFEMGVPAATGLVLFATSGLLAWRNLRFAELELDEQCVVRAGERADLEVHWGASTRGPRGRDLELFFLERHRDGRSLERVVGRCGWASVQPGNSSGSSATVRVARLFGRRGHFTEQRLRLRSNFPLGLWVAQRDGVARVDYRVTVRPGRLLPSWRWFESGSRGGQRKPRAGVAEFRGLRPWMSSEPAQRVRWKLAARHRDWQVTQWEEERAPVLWVQFDPRPARRRSPGWDTAFERALSFLVSLAISARSKDRELVLCWAGETPWRVASTRDVQRLSMRLASVEPLSSSAEVECASPAPGSDVLRVHLGRPRDLDEPGERSLDVLSVEFDRVFRAPGSLRAGGRA